MRKAQKELEKKGMTNRAWHNCAENGIYLKHIDPNSKQSGAYHRIIHTDQYYKTVNQRILDASNFGGRTGVLNELQRLQEDLLFNKQIW